MKKTEEIRFLLMGKLIALDDGRVVESEQGWRSGLPDGWSWLRLFGLSRRAQRFTADLPGEELQKAGIEALRHMGHLLVMSEAPMVPAALYRSWATEYALLTAEMEDDKLVLTAFAARSPIGGIKCRRLLKKCAAFLPEGTEAIYTEQEKREKKAKKASLAGLFRRKTPEEKQAAKEAKLRAAEERAAKKSAKRAEQAEKAAQRAEKQAAEAMRRAEEARQSAAAAAERRAHADQDTENDQKP